jgi:hypothetical protein
MWVRNGEEIKVAIKTLGAEKKPKPARLNC